MSGEGNAPALKVESLRHALRELEDAAHWADAESHNPHSPIARHLRGGTILAFEFSFELCVKLLRRALKITETSAQDIDDLGFAELLRLAYKRNLVRSELRVWQGFRTSRNRTSHTYSEAVAQVVFDDIPAFLAEAAYALERMAALEISPE